MKSSFQNFLRQKEKKISKGCLVRCGNCTPETSQKRFEAIVVDSRFLSPHSSERLWNDKRVCVAHMFPKGKQHMRHSRTHSQIPHIQCAMCSMCRSLS